MASSEDVKNQFLPQVKYVVPIASGKGGVGKSTVTVNIAIALKNMGYKVGIMDADVYGPTIPKMLGITNKPKSFNNFILPVEKFDLRVISMAFFIQPNEAVIWRGPLLHKMIHDFLGRVEWGELDFLLIDLPPGTGDIQLSLCQTIPLTGAVIVSTPQDVAWSVAQKAILMFDKLNVPILGVVENMSYYICGKCKEKEYIFGKSGAKNAAMQLELDFLGEIPLTVETREASDNGLPTPSTAFDEIAKKIVSLAPSMTSKKKVIPAKVSVSDKNEIKIEWSDGISNVYDAKKLRYSCPCARCVEEGTRKRVIKLESIPDGIKATAFNPIGSYALQIVWSDGHNTGLYGYKMLREFS